MHWLRARAPWADGALWPANRYEGGQALILFGDRCGADTFDGEPVDPVRLDGDGFAWLNGVLSRRYARVAEPAGASVAPAAVEPVGSS